MCAGGAQSSTTCTEIYKNIIINFHSKDYLCKQNLQNLNCPVTDHAIKHDLFEMCICAFSDMKVCTLKPSRIEMLSYSLKSSRVHGCMDKMHYGHLNIITLIKL